MKHQHSYAAVNVNFLCGHELLAPYSRFLRSFYGCLLALSPYLGTGTAQWDGSGPVPNPGTRLLSLASEATIT